MNQVDWRALVGLSVREPAEAAQAVMGLRLPRPTLWLALILMAALNALIFSVSNILVPIQAPMPMALSSPLYYFGFVVGGLALSIYAITWAGRWLGGQGSFDDVMSLMVWLQVLRVLVQAAAFVLMILAPVLSGVLVIGASLYGIYIILHFVNEAHRLRSLGRAFGVLMAALVVMVIVLSLLFSLIGAPLLGPTPYV